MGVEPSQCSCWLSGMNGKALVADTIRLPGTPWTLALWVRYLSACGPVNSRVAWTSAQTYFCTSAGSTLDQLLRDGDHVQAGDAELGDLLGVDQRVAALGVSWASGPAWT